MVTKPAIKDVVQTAFPSDSLEAAWAIASGIPALRAVMPKLIRVVLVIDATRANRELQFRLKTRRDATARSSFTEAIEAGVIIPIAPSFLNGEIEEHAAEIAERCSVSVDRVHEEWRSLRELFHFYQCEKNETSSQNLVDPDDAPYVDVLDLFQADAVFTTDKHFPKMGAPVVTLCFDELCRNYSRSKSVQVGVTLASGFTATVSLDLLVASARGLISIWKRIPDEVKALAGASLAIALLHPKSRRFILEKVRKAFEAIQKFGKPIGKSLMDLLLVLGDAELQARKLERQITSEIPEPSRRPLIWHAKIVCLMNTDGLNIETLYSKILQNGYASKSKNPVPYLRRVLKSDDNFFESGLGVWKLRQSISFSSADQQVTGEDSHIKECGHSVARGLARSITAVPSNLN